MNPSEMQNLIAQMNPTAASKAQSRQAEIAAMDEGMPTRPQYTSMLDPTTGLMKSQYQMLADPTAQQGLSQSGSDIDAIRGRATAAGPSAWAQMALQKQGLDEQAQRNQATTAGAGQQSGARAALAMQGGLSSGARERLALGGATAGLNAQQNIGAAGEQQRLGVTMQDQATKDQMLTQLPGMDLQKLNAWQGMKSADVNNALNENKFTNQQNLGAYQAQMQNWAAKNQAYATEHAGKKSSK